MQGDAEGERGIKHGAPDGPAVQRGLDVLVVELGWAERRGSAGWRETMDDNVDGEEEEGAGVAGHGERAGERSCWSWRGEEAFEERARGVHEQGSKHEVTFTEYGLVVLAPEHLIVNAAHGGSTKVSETDRIMVWKDKRTMAWEEPAEPPILAAAGAVRWTMRKVVMNGADPCASAVSTDDVRVRHAEGGAGPSAGCDAIGWSWCQSTGRTTPTAVKARTVVYDEDIGPGGKTSQCQSGRSRKRLMRAGATAGHQARDSSTFYTTTTMVIG